MPTGTYAMIHYLIDLIICYYFRYLSWEKVNLPQDGKINRRVMVEAALTNNATLVAALYDFDYRIDVDFLEGEK